MQIKDNEISNLHHVWRNVLGMKTLGAKFTFQSIEVKNRVYNARTNLTGSNVWLSEDLTKQTEELAYLARKAKKEKHLFKSWTFDGNLFIQFEKKGKAIRISSQKALSQALEQNKNMLLAGISSPEDKSSADLE